MHFWKFPSFPAIAAMVLILSPGLSQAEVSESYEYSVNNGSVTITGYVFRLVGGEIPSMIDGMPVTEIGESAFAYKSLNSGTIPSSVTKIGARAFLGNRNLKAFVIPSSVTSIGDQAFAECERVEEVTVPASLKEIGFGVFAGCSELSSLTLEAGLGEIGPGMFKDCRLNLTHVAIPSSVVRIGDEAFVGCSRLSSVSLGNGIRKIGAQAFAQTPLTSVKLPSSVIELGSGSFEECQKLAKVSLSEQLVEIPDRSFYGCKSLHKIKIPASVKRIGKSGFEATGLKSVELGDGLRDIGEKAFYSCNDISRVTFPPNVRTIGKYAFTSWNLKSLIFTGIAPQLADRAFPRNSRFNRELAIYLDKGATGFTVPRWEGYVTRRASPEIHVIMEGQRFFEDGDAHVRFPNAIAATGSSVKRITIENLGNLKLKKLSARITGESPWDYSVKTPTKGSISPGKSGMLEIEFTPRSKGRSHATLEIFSNDRNEGVFEVALSGVGVEIVR